MELDLAEVLGQETAKRALEVAAAGGHSVLLAGPPGAGKTMLAERFPGLLPPLAPAEAEEVAAVYRLCPREERALDGRRPFRRPPVTATPASMAGGGARARPGEVSLAHQGVLLLDDLPSFRPDTLAALQRPLAEGHDGNLPAGFLLLATMNPCPCERLEGRGECRCPPARVARHLRSVTGAFLDRIHLWVEVPPLPLQVRYGAGESTGRVAARVALAREAQQIRQGRLNAALSPTALQLHISLTAAAECFLGEVTRQLRLTARARANLLKVARTVADLAGSEELRPSHLAEAASIRRAA